MSLPFGETLKRLRIEKGYTQKQLADRLHVERPSIINWEACRRIPDAGLQKLHLFHTVYSDLY
ncbi:MAG: helix-turn-helix transcriptional regulator [Lachnospiraceae bacterium]|nr:helix-turn-helix transcriptional regulator [Lachnospiraceae bacterium]